MPKNFNELLSAMPKDRRARMEKRVQRTLELMELHELRRARKLSQQQLAAGLGTVQSEVSKIENRTDMHISTLSNYVKAMGGRLELRAVFPDATLNLELARRE